MQKSRHNIKPVKYHLPPLFQFINLIFALIYFFLELFEFVERRSWTMIIKAVILIVTHT